MFSVWHYQTGQNYEGSNYTKPVSESVIPPIHERIKGISSNPDTRKQEQNEKPFFEVADHKAQIRMADYALIGILLGIFGAYLLLRTLLYTRDAADAAKETLGIAKDTLNEAKEATRRELRAYIDCEEPSIASARDRNILELLLKFKFRNTGQTPAYVVKANGVMMTMIGASPQGENLTPFKAGNYTQIASGIEKNGEAEISVDISNLIDAAGNFLEGSSLYCLINVQYFDIYTVGKSDKSEKFTDAFVFECPLPILRSSMTPAIVNEKDKKTV